MEKLYDINELAKLLAVKPSWIRSQVFKKQIPYLKIGNLIRFESKAIKAWLQEKQNGPDPPTL